MRKGCHIFTMPMGGNIRLMSANAKTFSDSQSLVCVAASVCLCVPSLSLPLTFCIYSVSVCILCFDSVVFFPYTYSSSLRNSSSTSKCLALLFSLLLTACLPKMMIKSERGRTIAEQEETSQLVPIHKDSTLNSAAAYSSIDDVKAIF